MREKLKVVPKAKRHEFYKQALIEYVEYSMVLGSGLCSTLTKVTSTDCYGRQMQRFPEVHKHKPKDRGGYWWPTNNSQKRIEVLEEAIELTKPKQQ